MPPVNIFTKNIALSLPLALLIVALLPMSAEAFQPTLTCNTSGPYACQPGETPLPVLWPGAQVTFTINDQGTDNSTVAPGLPQALLETVLSSFAAWNQLECPGFEEPDNCSDMLLTYEGLTSQTGVGFDQAENAKNINLVVWRDQNWNQIASDQTFALTSVTFNPNTGRIVDADLEINSEIYTLNIGDPVDPNLADLENTLVHEVGHFVGLDHSSVRDATMFANADLGETKKRTLAADDIDAICASYPPSFVSKRHCDNAYVDPTPNLNPNAANGGGDSGGGSGGVFVCATYPGAVPALPAFLLALAALLGATRLRRRFERS